MDHLVLSKATVLVVLGVKAEDVRHVVWREEEEEEERDSRRRSAKSSQLWLYTALLRSGVGVRGVEMSTKKQNGDV